MTSSRVTAGQAWRVAERLGIRDWEIFDTLSRVRVASGRQLERLHFFDSTPLTNARLSRRVLERLTNWQVLARLERRVGGVRAGSAGFLYTLGVVGQRLRTRGGPAGGRRYQRPWTPSHPFLAHALAVTELYVLLSEASRQAEFGILAFDAEPACWRRFTGAAGEIVTLKPDAFIRLAAPEFIDHVFVEVDRGTESAHALGLKFDRYRQYWSSGREQGLHGVFPRVLWLVPDPGRRGEVVDVASRQPAEAWRLFQVAEYERAMPALIGGDGA